MPSVKKKTHKGIKKRFKITANGKVLHKRCGSSHLMSHKSGKQVRRLRKKSVVQITAEAQRLRRAAAFRREISPEASVDFVPPPASTPVDETPAAEPQA